MKIIGHRGARGLAPENTVAAILKGMEHKVDLVEFDLRVTKDGIVVLDHDGRITDPNGERHTISQTNYTILKAHKPDLSTFQEVLDATKGRVKLYVEVKKGEPIKPIVAIINSALGNGWQESDLLLGSKSQKTLTSLHTELPAIKKVVIHPWSGVISTHRAKQVDTKIIAMNQLSLWTFFIRSMSKRGWVIYAYTLNDPEKAKHWQKYGLAGVVTDNPQRFRG